MSDPQLTVTNPAHSRHARPARCQAAPGAAGGGTASLAVLKDLLEEGGRRLPIGFFLSVASPRAERPNRMILFAYAGAVLLAVGTLTLGIGLLR